ncbi:NAD(P)-binding domain-containing protein [Paenirhodobacter populi]|nr:NAD(P)-binding domain-containing protein [Sinirhodobacter populi]
MTDLPSLPENWVPPRPDTDLDVLIIGGSQSGMAIARALRQAGIGRVRIVEAGPEGSFGMWTRAARMPVLRTPKTITGPELGHRALGYPMWHDLQYGKGSFDALDAIRTADWIAYLSWYRRVTEAPIDFEATVTAIERSGAHFTVTTGRGAVRVRKIILATGFAGCGGVVLPEVLAPLATTGRITHSDQAISADDLAGRRVAVIGAAASAFDAAGAALNAGAVAVHLLARRDTIVSGSPNRARSYPGALDNYHLMPDRLRWEIARAARSHGMNPPARSVARVAGDMRFSLHLAAPVEAAAWQAGEIRLVTPAARLAVDFVIAATGYSHDPARDPLLGPFAAQIQTWADRIGAESRSPWLDAHFALAPKAGGPDWLADIHVFTPVAAASHGRVVGDSPSLAGHVPLLVSGIARDLFLADLQAHEQRLLHGDAAAAEFPDSLWSQAALRAAE